MRDLIWMSTAVFAGIAVGTALGSAFIFGFLYFFGSL
jgi:hypothetical protein